MPSRSYLPCSGRRKRCFTSELWPEGRWPWKKRTLLAWWGAVRAPSSTVLGGACGLRAIHVTKPHVACTIARKLGDGGDIDTMLVASALA